MLPLPPRSAFLSRLRTQFFSSIVLVSTKWKIAAPWLSRLHNEVSSRGVLRTLGAEETPPPERTPPPSHTAGCPVSLIHSPQNQQPPLPALTAGVRGEEAGALVAWPPADGVSTTSCGDAQALSSPSMNGNYSACFFLPCTMPASVCFQICSCVRFHLVLVKCAFCLLHII